MSPLIYKINGDDVVIISEVNRSWYFTNQQGLRVWKSRDKEIGQICQEEQLSQEEVQEFLQDISDTLLSAPLPTQNTKGGSIHLLNQCNLRCGYCRYSCHQNMPGVVSKQDISWFIEELAKEKATLITLTGGEPTLRWDLIEQAIKKADEHHIHVNILSNGKNGFTGGQLELLKKHKINMQISLDSLIDNVNMKTRTVDSQTVQNTLLQLSANNINCGVSMVLNRHNYQEVDDMTNWCLENGIKYLHFPFLEKGGRADQSWDKLALSINELLSIFKKLLTIWMEGQVPPKFFKEFYTIMEKIESPHTMVSCNAGINNCCLAPDGLYPCVNYVGNSEMRIGKLGEISLAQAKEGFFRTKAFDYHNHDTCGDCDWGWICCGGCRDRAELADGTDPYCEIFKFLYEKILWYTVNSLEGGD